MYCTHMSHAYCFRVRVRVRVRIRVRIRVRVRVRFGVRVSTSRVRGCAAPARTVAHTAARPPGPSWLGLG